MKYLLPDDRLIGDEQFTLGDFVYPSNWLSLASPEDLSSRGITTVPDPEPAPPTAEQLKAYARNKREDVIAAGCIITTVGGPLPVWTDARSRIAIMGALMNAQMNPAYTTTWKGRDGVFYEIDAADIQAVAVGMGAFVQACFATESDCALSIDASEIDEVAQIDAADWPSND